MSCGVEAVQMRILKRVALLALTAVLVGCAASQPIGTPALVPPGAAKLKTRGWETPAKLGDKDLIYISSAPTVYMFLFPKGKYVGQLQDTAYPQGLCGDNAGDVFVVDNTASQIEEYKHGALQPRRILPYPTGSPTGCAFDTSTGNLAMMSGEDLSLHKATLRYDVWIYRHAKGRPRLYHLNSLNYLDYLCYDDGGNLFVDGRPQYGRFGLVELPKGEKQFVELKLDKKTIKKVREPGAVQWSGGFLAVGDDAYPNDYIVRLSISGTTVTYAGLTQLRGSSGLQEFWIQGDRVVATQDDAAAIWRYPAGGQPVKTLKQSYAGYGAIVSLASH